MKAIILAGGLNTRLFPSSACISKQLLPVYDKPMIYYPISTIMLAGIHEILIISTPQDIPLFKKLLGDGSQWGVQFSYGIQEEPKGIADAFLIGESFIGDDSVCLMLGDNIIYGHQLNKIFPDPHKPFVGATVFGYHVTDPERYGVLKFDPNGKIIDIIEKPKQAPSNYAVSGLYFYDKKVIDIAKALKPSARGELEITDVNREYLSNGELNSILFGRGVAWLDTGTHESLLEASHFFHVLEHRQGLKVGSPEETAWRMQFISSDQLRALAQPLMKSGYGQYLMELTHECKND